MNLVLVENNNLKLELCSEYRNDELFNNSWGNIKKTISHIFHKTIFKGGKMSIKKVLKFGTLVLVLTLLISGFSYAQRLTGKIVGDITDEEGIPLPGVTVEISSPALMGGVHTQVTTRKGNYRFINLPPGTYKLVFKREGFQELERENLIVSVGKTVTENIVLKMATIEESITITAESPVVDVTESGMSTTFGKDELEKIPAGRFSMFDIIKQAPGMQQTAEDSDRMVSFGSNTESNSMRLDGVELSDPDIGIPWLYVPQDMFAEVETMGIGAPAEFGHFTGAVINVVTKSGGNKFEGAIAYYGQFQALTDDNNLYEPLDPSVPPEEAYLYPDSRYSFHRDKFLYLSFALGGPIIKDKLWFFGMYERSDESTSWMGIHPDFAVEWPANKAFFKLSAQITERHRLGGHFYYEDFDYPDALDIWTSQEALGSEIGEVYSWNVMYTWQISNNAIFDLKYAGYWSRDDYLPDSGDMDLSPIWDFGSGEVWGGLAYAAWKWKVQRHQAHADLSYYAEDFLGGDHDFKIGVQYNRGDSRYPEGYTGGRWYYYYYGYPYYMYQRDVFYVGGIVNSFGVFVDDSWKIGERLTVNLGLRFDFSSGSVPELPIMDGWTKTSAKSPAVDDVVVWNTISPRIGIAFQLTSDQKTLLKASYGRYYDALHMANWDYPGPNATDENVYYFDWWDTLDWALWYTIPGGMDYSVDENLKNPYADQFSLGLEREILPNFSAGLTFLYKKEQDLLGMIDVGGTYEQISVVSDDDGRTYQVWNQTNVGTKDILLTNVKDYYGATYEQTYTALIFTLTKRYSNNWMLNASLTWSKSEGINMIGQRTSSNQQAMVWYAGGFGEDPNDLTNAYGRMQNDRPWIFKVQAGYTFPWGILASLNYIYQTGRPAPTLVWVTLDQGWVRLLAEPRGEERFPDWSMLDFRLQKTFNIYQTVRLSAIIDVFNLLNADTVTSYASYEMWQQAIYHEPLWNFNPRRVQIGLRLEF